MGKIYVSFSPEIIILIQLKRLINNIVHARRGCNVIIFVVDGHAMHMVADARIELHRLLEDK